MQNLITNQIGNPTYNVFGEYPITITPSKASRRMALATKQQRTFVKKAKEGYIEQFAYFLMNDEDKFLDCYEDIPLAELKSVYPELKWIVNAVEGRNK